MAGLNANQILDRKVLYPGNVLIMEGDPGDSAYYIQSNVKWAICA